MSFEQHTHAVITGPRRGLDIEHSHDGGSRGHRHPDTGPGMFVIDAAQWETETGMKGGGRKVFTRKPAGEQLEYVERDPSEARFTVVFGKSALGVARGPASPAVARMALSFDMTPEFDGGAS